ncbi:MAG: GTA-gp10 family protein [Bacillota bacterium]
MAKLVLGGKERELKVTMGALARIEEEYGTLEAAGKALVQGSARAFLIYLWACLVEDDPSLTKEDVGKMLSVASANLVIGALNQAFKEAFGGMKQPSGGKIQQLLKRRRL